MPPLFEAPVHRSGLTVLAAIRARLLQHLRRRAEWYLVPLFFAAVVALVYREILLGEKGVGWDLIDSYWPDLNFFARQLRRGNFPLWNPGERGGVPALGDPQNALFYPVQWLLAGWGALRGQASWSLIQFKELFHHALAATLLYLYVRTRRMAWPAALTAGLVVVMAEVWVQLKSNNFLQAVAWTPLVWIAIDALLARPQARRAVALAAALYLPAAVGSPPGYWYTLLAATFYGLFRAGVLIADLTAAARAARDADEPHPWRMHVLLPLGRLAGCLGLALLLVAATQAVMLLPVKDLLALSPRADRTVEFALQGESHHVAVLAGLLAPLRMTYAIHCGLLTPLLALLALLLGARRDRAAPIFFALAGTFFLLCAFGPATPLLRFLVEHVPGFGLFRISTRYLVVFPLCWGALAAHGLTVLLDPRTRRARQVAVVLAAALLIAAATRWARNVEPQLIFSDGFPWPPLGPSLLVGLFALAVVGGPRRWSPAIVSGGLLLFFGYHSQVVRRGLGYEARPDHLEDLAKIAQLGDLAQVRVYDEFLLEQRAGSRLGLREFRGYPSEDPLARTDYLQILAAATAPGGLPLLGEYNVRYVLYGPHSTKGWGRRRLPGPPDVVAPQRFTRITPQIFELRFWAPQIAWYGGAMRVVPTAVLPTVKAARDDRGVRRVAVLTEGATPPALEPRIAPLLAAPAPPAGIAGRVTRFETERIEAEITAPAAGIVVLNEFMYPGWHAFVDGSDRDGDRVTVDLCLRGVLVGPGQHQIRWEYRPPHWTALLVAWLLGVAVFLATWVAALSASRSRRQGRPRPLAGTV
jgi:hypothetical protein